MYNVDGARARSVPCDWTDGFLFSSTDPMTEGALQGGLGDLLSGYRY
jgi:hypothetical protein